MIKSTFILLLSLLLFFSCNRKLDLHQTIDSDLENFKDSSKDLPFQERKTTNIPSEGKKNLTLSTPNGYIVVMGGINQNEIQLETLKCSDKKESLEKIIMTPNDNQDRYQFFPTIPGDLKGRVNIKGTIPKDITCELSTISGSILIKNLKQDIKMNTRAGSIKMIGSAGTVDAILNGDGGIVAENHNGKINAKLQNGTFKGNKLVGDVTCSIKNGVCDLNEVTGNFDCTIENGSFQFNKHVGSLKSNVKMGFISGKFTPQKANNYDLINGNGSVSVQVPYNASLKVKIKVVNGGIDTDFKELKLSPDKSEIDGVVNNGEATLTINATNGTVSLSHF